MRRIALFFTLVCILPAWAAPVRVINVGVPGQNSREGRARFQQDVLDHHPAVVLLYFGMNDAVNEPKFLPADEFVANMAWMAETARSHGIIPILATIQHVDVVRVMARHKASAYGDEGVNGKIDRYNSALLAMAHDRRLAVAGLTRALDEAGGPTEALSVDGVHLTPAGYRIMAQTFLRNLPPRIAGSIVCLGDSLTLGVPLKPGEKGSYPQQLEELLQ